MYKYYGNGAYCYANAASMLLSSINEDVTPSFLEVATAFGLSAQIENDILFFDNVLSSPVKGINKAFQILGYDVHHDSYVNASNPLECLEKDLQQGPVMLGPIDMGELTYNPNHKFMKGSDHFILGILAEHNMLRLHDPGGYPYAEIELKQFCEAWAAEEIHYHCGYGVWKNPRVLEHLTKKEKENRIMMHIRDVYGELDKNKQDGAQYIKDKAHELLEKGLDDAERNHYIYFTFPLGAKRALDFSSFFKQFNTSLSKQKQKQALLFGEIQSLALKNDWHTVAQKLHDIADLEKEMQQTIRKM